MEQAVLTTGGRTRPAPGAVLELLKPITWFAPMRAFGCGGVSSGAPGGGQWPAILTGVALDGPPVCATSQAADRGTGAGHGGERAAARRPGRPAAGRAGDRRPASRCRPRGPA